ncbi:PFGI-1 class ICE element type IV pilus protein PilL2 [Pasteurella testudinis]|uniref:PFGI-1 class ICE element type IV pilus protein PilL2 n=1 Tax=Pasteurella testudinis TaxID=761 RepID=UPI00405A27E5
MNKSLIAASLCLILGACVQQPQSQSDTTTYPLPEQPLLTTGSQVNTSGITMTEIIEPPKPQERIILPDIYEQAAKPPAEIIRHGRYTLVSMSPEEGQKYLLDQLVTVKVPQKNKNRYTATVEQGLKTTLNHTGFALCSGFGQADTATLFSRPLPKVHYQFGPMKLSDALQMLAGPAYDVTLNDITRTICFQSRPVPERAIAPVVLTTTTVTTEVIEDE